MTTATSSIPSFFITFGQDVSEVSDTQGCRIPIITSRQLEAVCKSDCDAAVQQLNSRIAELEAVVNGIKQKYQTYQAGGQTYSQVIDNLIRINIVSIVVALAGLASLAHINSEIKGYYSHISAGIRQDCFIAAATASSTLLFVIAGLGSLRLAADSNRLVNDAFKGALQNTTGEQTRSENTKFLELKQWFAQSVEIQKQVEALIGGNKA